MRIEEREHFGNHLRVFGDARKMIPAGDFDVLVRDSKLVHLLDPVSRNCDRNQTVLVTLDDDEWQMTSVLQFVGTRVDGG